MRGFYRQAGRVWGLLLRDTFTGPDGTALAARAMDVGPGWTEESGAWELQGNRAVQTAAGGAAYLASADAGRPDARVQAELLLPAAGSFDAGVLARFQDAGNHWLGLAEHPGGGRFTLYEMNGGLLTARGSATVPAAGTTATLALAAASQTLVLEVNGVERVRYAAAAFLAGATRCGLRNYRDGSFQQVPADGFEARAL